MRISGDAARLVIDGLSPVSVAIRAAIARALILWTISVYAEAGTLSPVILLICALSLVFVRRAFTQRPRLVLDRAAGEMVLTRGGEEIRRPLSGLRRAGLQRYDPAPSMPSRRRGMSRDLSRMALVTDKGMVPFEMPYRDPARARRLAEAVNGWLGVDAPPLDPEPRRE